MSLARVHAMGLKGVDGYPVLVELDLAGGLPGFSMVGLPDDAVREARERVAAALRNSGYAMPNRRVTVNLSPARPRKQGSHYELPIALAVLAASGQIDGGEWMKLWCVVGELSLDGRVRCGFLFHAFFERVDFRHALCCGVVAHVLGDFH